MGNLKQQVYYYKILLYLRKASQPLQQNAEVDHVTTFKHTVSCNVPDRAGHSPLCILLQQYWSNTVRYIHNIPIYWQGTATGMQ